MEKQNKRRQLLLIAAVCFSSWGYMSDSAVIPLASAIYAEFPGASVFIQNFVLSGSCLVAIPFALLSGILTRYISKKRILLCSMTLFMLGGIGGFFSNSIEFLALTRALDGASDGISVTVAGALIAELFDDETLRGHVYGWNQAASAVFGVLMSMFAGWAVVHIGWRYAFLIHLIDFGSLFLVLRYVPDVPVSRQEDRKKRQGLKTRGHQLRLVLATLAVYLLFTILCSQVFYTIDLYISEMGIGNAMLSGTASAVMTVVMCVVDLIFGVFYMKTKSVFPILFCIANTLGLACFSGSASAGLAIVGAGLTSFCSACTVPYFQLIIASHADSEDVGLFMSVFAVLMYLGSFLAPYAYSAVSAITSDPSVQTTYRVCTAVMALITVGYTGICIRRIRKAKKETKKNG